MYFSVTVFLICVMYWQKKPGRKATQLNNYTVNESLNTEKPNGQGELWAQLADELLEAGRTAGPLCVLSRRRTCKEMVLVQAQCVKQGVVGNHNRACHFKVFWGLRANNSIDNGENYEKRFQRSENQLGPIMTRIWPIKEI